MDVVRRMPLRDIEAMVRVLKEEHMERQKQEQKATRQQRQGRR